MYYSFPCTYCRKVFYTFDSNKHRAAITLYRTIKQHLIDDDEDKNEYELDDGEHLDTNQIYDEMKTSTHETPGGYRATKTSTVIHPSEKIEHSTATAHSSHKHDPLKSSLVLLLFLFILLLGAISLFFFFPDMFTLELPKIEF